MQFETHDVSRHSADEAAARYRNDQGPHASKPDVPYTPVSPSYDFILDNAERMLRTDPNRPTIAHAIDVGSTVRCGRYGMEERLLHLPPQDREYMAAELVRRFGPATLSSDEDDPSAFATGYYERVQPRPSARLNLLAAGQSLAPSSSIRREMAVTGLDLSGVLDTRRPIDPTDAFKIQSVLAATHTDLEGFATQSLVASAKANAGFGDLVRGAVDALVTGTNNAMEALAVGALQRTFESETRTQRGAITDGRGRVITPATEEHSHLREQENFPAKTTLTAGGGTAQITGARVFLHSGFKAAAAVLTGGSGSVDPDARVSIRVGTDYAEASGYGDSIVAAAGGAHVDIGAPSATITVGPTTISRG